MCHHMSPRRVCRKKWTVVGMLAPGRAGTHTKVFKEKKEKQGDKQKNLGLTSPPHVTRATTSSQGQPVVTRGKL